MSDDIGLVEDGVIRPWGVPTADHIAAWQAMRAQADMTLPKQNLVAYYPLEATTTPNLTCETCQHFVARPGAFLGDCAAGAVYGRVRFDYAPPDGRPCAQHTSNAPTLTQQSEARGMTYPQWQAKVRG